jgi:hypothetical protein
MRSTSKLLTATAVMALAVVPAALARGDAWRQRALCDPTDPVDPVDPDNRPVPLPMAGAGLPFLLAAGIGGAYILSRRQRDAQAVKAAG